MNSDGQMDGYMTKQVQQSVDGVEVKRYIYIYIAS